MLCQIYEEIHQIKISIITACLNAVKTIEQTLQSVLNQDYPNLEYIIIDGGSTDGTLEIINKYRERLAVVISEPDNGIYDAFNKGLKHATGDIIGILNADDFYAPWAIQTIADVYVEAPNADVFYGNVVVVDEQNAQWKIYPLGSPENLNTGMSLSHPATFVTRKAYEKYGIFDDYYRIAADWDLMLRFKSLGAVFYPVNKVLTAFRNSGISCNPPLSHLEEIKKVGEQYLTHKKLQQLLAISYIKHCCRFVLKKTKTYWLYSLYRDKKIYNIEKNGKFAKNKKISIFWQEVACAIQEK